MKNLIVCLLSTVTCTVGMCANSFDGFYAGASAGYTTKSQKLSMTGTSVSKWGRIDINSNQTKHIKAFHYGLVAGYGYVLKTSNVYLGAEMNFHHDTAAKDSTYDIIYSTRSNTVSVPLKARYERSPVFGFAPRVGLVFADSYMAFIKPGIEISRDRINLQFPDKLRYTSARKTKVTFVPGIGLTKAINDRFLVTVSYDYSLGNKLSEDDKDGNTVGNCTIKYTSHTLKLSAAYRF